MHHYYPAKVFVAANYAKIAKLVEVKKTVCALCVFSG